MSLAKTLNFFAYPALDTTVNAPVLFVSAGPIIGSLFCPNALRTRDSPRVIAREFRKRDK